MKKSIGNRIFNIINVMIIALISIVSLYPYINQIAISLNDGVDSMRGGITIWPRMFTFSNYKSVFTNPDFMHASFLSVIRVVLSTVLSLAVVFSAAYGLTRKGLPYRRGITLFLMIPSYISAGMIPTYMNLRDLHLINNYLVYILPTLFVFYNMVIIRSFLQDLPVALEESAKLDEANDFIIMFRIIFPLSMPVIATVALWVAVGAWNDWTTTLYYITDKDLHVLQYLMMRLIKESEVAQEMALQTSMNMGLSRDNISVTTESLKSASLIVTTIPIVMVYPFLQKYFIKGVTLGAVKE